MFGDVITIPMMCDQFTRTGQVNPIDVGVRDRRCSATKIPLFRAGLSSHVHNLSASSSTNNAVINEKNNFVFEFFGNRIELGPYAPLAGTLRGHDKSPENVAILDKALAIRLLEVL